MKERRKETTGQKYNGPPITQGGHKKEERNYRMKILWSALLHRATIITLPRRETHWNYLGCPKLTKPISAASGPKFSILWGHVKEILLLNKFFPIVGACLSCEDIARQSCAMVPRWRFLATFLHPLFSACSVLHSKFALRPHHVWKYGRHPISDHWD